MDGKAYTKQNEGLALHAYADPLTKGAPYACGWGCLWDANGHRVTENTVWTMEQAEAAFDAAYHGAEQKCRIAFSNWLELPEPIKAAVTDMAFQVQGFPRRWPHFHSAIMQKNYKGCASEIRVSLYAEQTPNRAKRNAALFDAEAKKATA